MITKIARKEFVEMWRDGRFRVAAAIVFALLVMALAAGAQHYQTVKRQHDAAQSETRELWLAQGEKNPHSAAHYGSYAFKPVLLPSLLDNGVNPYTGVAAYLEAHKQNDFKFRPAQDATIAQRFGELTAANTLQLLLPLLIILFTFAAFAGERESGTLRQILSLGVKPRDLAFGKAMGVSAALAVLLVPAAIIGSLTLVMVSENGAFAASLPRFVLMTVSYLLYFAIFLFIALAVSAVVKTSRTALVVLLAFWIFNCLAAPRIAADVARIIYQTPSSYEFSKTIADDITNGIDGHNPADKRAEDLEKRVTAQYNVERVEDLPVSFAGIALTESENYSTEVFNRRYNEVWDEFERQNQARQILGFLAPLLGVRSLSMGLAGTDFAQARSFTAAAEKYRFEFVKAMNDDMTVNAVKKDFEYKASAGLWSQVPDFSYQPPNVGTVMRGQIVSAAVLLFWSLLSFFILVWTIKKLRID